MAGYAHRQDGQLVRLVRSSRPRRGEGPVQAELRLEDCPEEAVVVQREASGLERVDLAATLDRILGLTGADAAEFFVAVPHGRRLMLAAHRGEAARAFLERTEFEFGEGFPGLTAATGEAVLSVDLPYDERYLRTSVKTRGFWCYVCVPVPSSRGILGTLNVAARRHRVDLSACLPFLREVAGCLGSALEREARQSAEFLSRAWTAASGAGPPEPRAGRSMDILADRLTHLAGAKSGLLLLMAGRSCGLHAAVFCGAARPVEGLTASRAWPACLALVRQSPVVVRRLDQCPSPGCRAAHAGAAVRLCVPLVAGGSTVGVFSAGYRRRALWPGRHLLRLVAGAELLAAAADPERGHHSPDGGGSKGIGTAAEPPEGSADGRKLPTTPGAGPGFLDIRCLGRFSVIRDGVPVPPVEFRRRRALLVLKILLTRYGRPVHRDELIEWLWQGEPPEKAGQLLQSAVHYLRRALEPDLRPGGRSRFVLTEGDAYLFNPDAPHRLDAREFLATARMAEAMERRGELSEALAACREAAGLYAGHFLEDEPYSDWCAREREYLRSVYLDVLRRLGRLCARQGDYAQAIDAFRRALSVDPLLEDVHRALMGVLWRAGRRIDALEQFYRCRAILEGELGVAPAAETEALYRSILEDRGLAAAGESQA